MVVFVFHQLAEILFVNVNQVLLASCVKSVTHAFQILAKMVVNACQTVKAVSIVNAHQAQVDVLVIIVR